MIDASGSMFDRMDWLRPKLAAEIRRMQPYQKFGIIFYSDAPNGLPGGLVWTTPRAKSAALQFIEGVVCEGKADLLRAIRPALELKPELLILVTDRDVSRQTADAAGALVAASPTLLVACAYDAPSPTPNLKRLAGVSRGYFGCIPRGDD